MRSCTLLLELTSLFGPFSLQRWTRRLPLERLGVGIVVQACDLHHDHDDHEQHQKEQEHPLHRRRRARIVGDDLETTIWQTDGDLDIIGGGGGSNNNNNNQEEEDSYDDDDAEAFCGTPLPDPTEAAGLDALLQARRAEKQAKERARRLDELSDRGGRRRRLQKNKAEKEFAATVLVVYHCIRPDEAETVSDAVIVRQHEVLNEAFAGTGFAFELADIVRYPNRPEWYGSRFEDGRGMPNFQMKRHAHVGDAATLNVYVKSFPSEGLAGVATLPTLQGRLQAWRDGVELSEKAVSGGRFAPVGNTLVHEVRFWVGLAPLLLL